MAESEPQGVQTRRTWTG